MNWIDGERSRLHWLRADEDSSEFWLRASPLQLFLVHPPDVRLEVAFERERVRAERAQEVFPLLRWPEMRNKKNSCITIAVAKLIVTLEEK